MHRHSFCQASDLCLWSGLVQGTKSYFLFVGRREAIHIYICIYIIRMHMYMMNFINLPVCFITFDDVAIGCSKVSVF